MHLPRGKCCAASAARLSAKKEPCSGGCTSVLDMEVIVGSEGNTVLLDWLDYIRDQIACRPYADKSSFWYNAKMRYVFNTTGPYSMRRFLKLPSNVTMLQNVKYLECNWFKDVICENRKRLYDVISLQSQSYFTKEHSIHVPVGPGNAVLPTFPTAKRMRVKSAVRRMSVSNYANNDATEQFVHATRAHSQGVYQPSLDDDVVDTCSWITDTIDGAVDLMTNVMSDVLVDSMTMAVERAQLDSRAERRRINEMKTHFHDYKNCVAAKVVLADMPRELRQWLTTSENQ